MSTVAQPRTVCMNEKNGSGGISEPFFVLRESRFLITIAAPPPIDRYGEQNWEIAGHMAHAAALEPEDTAQRNARFQE